jgi:hypothetical protein
MATLAELMVDVATILRDPENRVFEDADLRLFIELALAEISDFAPERFTEDIAPVADQSVYQVRASVLPDDTPEIQLGLVELWDTGATPAVRLAELNPASNERGGGSQAGWRMWNGSLRLSDYQMRLLDPDRHSIRVYGYSPYAQPDSDDDTLNLSASLQRALLVRCRIEGYNQLDTDRNLFTQWQTRANNSDVSPAALHQGLTLARDEWRQRVRALTILRDSN